MVDAPDDPMEKAVSRLWQHRTIRHGERSIVLAILLRTQDWRPLDAPWWRGKQASIIGADVNGNFVFRHCDGSVRFWDHGLQSDEVLAPSVKAFVTMLA
jgi:hypothetical protein